MELTQLNYELYLAVSHLTYQAFFTQKAAQMVIQRHNLNLLIVDIDDEEIVKWIKSPVTKR